MITPPIIIFDGEGAFFYGGISEAESSLEWLDVIRKPGSNEYERRAFDSKGIVFEFKCRDITGKVFGMETKTKGVELVRKSDIPNSELLRELLNQWLKDEAVPVNDNDDLNEVIILASELRKETGRGAK
jgi:hypothetical protein